MKSSRRGCAFLFSLAAVLLAGGAAAGREPPASASGPPLPTTAAAWSAAAQRDVQAAYQLMADNHPGMFNREDPGFPARLAAARTRGLRLARRARDAAGFSAALDAFSAVLRDGHARLVADLPESSTPQRWPGFVAVWRGDRLRVFASEVPGLPAGAVILGCDGRSVRSLVLSNVFAFAGDPDVAGQWWVRAGDLFRDEGNPFIRRPQRCRVSEDGGIFDQTLAWRPVDAQYKAWREQGFGGGSPAGLTEPRPKLFWLTMPTFSPNETQRTAYRSAFQDLQRRRAEILAADAVVIDLRGNHGGSSFWSGEAARSLWGAAALDNLSDPSRVWWRASPANTRYVTGLVETLRAGGLPEEVAFVERVGKGMNAALQNGQPYWIEPDQAPTPASTPAADAAPALRTPVYVIVSGMCGSACLDALDLFTRFPNTKLIGAPSSADTVYLEVRVETLPDGLAKVVIPNKLYRNRPRRSGQGYAPAIEVDELDWSTAAFRKVVEADLQSRGRQTAGQRGQK